MDILPREYKGDVISYTKDLIQFIQDYYFLIDYFQTNSDTGSISKDYFNHFIINNHYEKVPKDWREPLEALSMVDLLKMVTLGQVDSSLPETIKKYASTAKTLDLRKECSDFKEDFNDFLLSYAMGLKKQHEVARLGALINSVAVKVESKTIIDIGSGKGYLTSVLDLKYGLNCVGVDRKEDLTKKTDFRRDEIEVKAKTLGKEHKTGSTNSVACHLSLEVNTEEFLMLIEPFAKEKGDFILCGLHTCGDLAATTINLFLKSRAKAMVNVGCCFDKISEEWISPKVYAFPMSDLVKRSKLILGNAKFLAVLSLDSWTVENKDDSDYHFTRNTFRVVLEALLHQNLKKSMTEKCFVVRVNAKYSKSFVPYAQAAIKRIFETEKDLFHDDFIKMAVSEDFSLFLGDYYQKYEKAGIRKKVEVYWSLRAILGPVIEALILMDRVVYLQEQGAKVDLIRLFKYEISPRGLAIVAWK